MVNLGLAHVFCSAGMANALTQQSVHSVPPKATSHSRNPANMQVDGEHAGAGTGMHSSAWRARPSQRRG